MDIAKEILKKLDSLDIKYKLIELPKDISLDIRDHMEFHDAPMSQALSTLIFKTDKGKFVAIQKKGDTKINNSKLRKVLNAKKMAFATKEELTELGYSAGLIPLTNLGIQLYIDEKVVSQDTMYCGLGDNKLAIKFNPKDLTTINSDALVVDVTDYDNTSVVKITQSGPAFDRLLSFLEANNISHEILDSGTESLDLDEQIRAFNMKYREGMGTLLYKTDTGRYIALFRRDDRSVDLRKFRDILKVNSLDMCDINDLRKFGFEAGLLMPLTLPKEIEIFIDESSMEMEEMITGAGSARHALKIKKEDLLKNIHSFKVVNVTFPNPFRQDNDNRQINRVLSGITTSGNQLHIGNYFGAVKPQMDLQKVVEKSFYFAADLHALTTVQNKEVLQNNIVNNVLDFIALGLDPKKSAYFRQSDVPAHSQLMVVLGNYIPLSLMKRMHAFKDKLQKGMDENAINMGLFNYPILMAADILLYKPDGVPVGEDQRQHVELTRDVAHFYNRAYDSEFFPLPEPLIQSGYTGKVVGTDGERKMSKSLGNVIGIFDDEETITKQIMSCYTDPNRIKATDPGTVEGNPVFVFHDLINENKDEVNELKDRYRKGTVGDVEVKKKLIAAHKARFEEAKEKRQELAGNIDLAKDILSDGAKVANEFANQTLEEVYDMIGMKNELSVLFGK